MTNQRVEVVISGGMGNQLFQYAAGQSLSKRLNSELALDLSWYMHSQGLSQRRMELDKFVDLKDVQILRTSIHPKAHQIRRVLQGYKIIDDSNYNPEKFDSFVSNRDIRINGYWQSERYFSKIADELRDSIVRSEFGSTLTSDVARSIVASKCIGIHVRRGDYIADPKTKAFHGVCDVNYFLAGVEFISQSRIIDSLFIFSDDIAWCAENLKFDKETKIIDSSICDTDQLKLLSLCNHHIISNSSFSWWAAWLGAKDAQCVVYPKGWFADGRDLESMPSDWIAL